MKDDEVTTVGKLRQLIDGRHDEEPVTAYELRDLLDEDGDWRLTNRWDF